MKHTVQLWWKQSWLYVLLTALLCAVALTLGVTQNSNPDSFVICFLFIVPFLTVVLGCAAAKRQGRFGVILPLEILLFGLVASLILGKNWFTLLVAGMIAAHLTVVELFFFLSHKCGAAQIGFGYYAAVYALCCPLCAPAIFSAYPLWLIPALCVVSVGILLLQKHRVSASLAVWAVLSGAQLALLFTFSHNWYRPFSLAAVILPAAAVLLSTLLFGLLRTLQARKQPKHQT